MSFLKHNTPMTSLANRIGNTLTEFPDRVLIADATQTWTGRDVAQKISEIEKFLQVSTLPGSIVGVCFPSLAYMGLAILAVIKSGRVPVILSHTDLLQQPKTWLERVPMDLLLTTGELKVLSHSFVNTLELTEGGEIIVDVINKNALARVRAPEGTALILYTSGSTGVPKGVCVPEEGITSTCNFLTEYFDLSPETVTPIVLPVCHSMALNTQFLPTFLAGGQSIFMESRLEINRIFRHITGHNSTFVSLIGEVLRVCWDEMTRRKLPPNLTVKHVQLAGGLISKKHLQMASELFPNALIHKGYGLTEAIRVTMIDHRDPLFLQNVVGTPLPFQTIEIRHPDNRRALPGESGEIFVKGPNVMLGILGTALTSVASDGFLGTGDLGSLNEKGQLEVLGRKDSIFKLNGVKVSGVEIETVATSVSSYVREAKCILVEDQRQVRNKIILFLEVSKDLESEFYKNYFEIFHTALWSEFKNLTYFPKDIIILQKFPRTNNGKLAISELHNIWKTQNSKSLIQNPRGAFMFYKDVGSLTDSYKENQ